MSQPTQPGQDVPDEQVAEVVAAIARGEAVVCLTRCWSCQFDCHFDPPRPHTWMDKEDAAHAGHPWPLSDETAAAHRCGCHCARGTS